VNRPRRAASNPHAEASRMIEGIREVFPAPSFAVFEQVPNTVGPAVLRRADAFAVRLAIGPGFDMQGFEVKTRRADLVRELRDPEKSAPFALFCRCWWLVVPAPWKRVVLTLSELPRMWGVIEVGTGDPLVVRAATERHEAERPDDNFVKALLGAAVRSVTRELRGAGDAQPQPIVARLSRDFVALGCGHRALAPLDKPKNARPCLPCFACAEGLPYDTEVVAAALEAADPEQLMRYRARLDELLGVHPGPALASCSAPAPELPAARGAA
jgi:hypothetical protein